MSIDVLKSYLKGEWVSGDGQGATLINPSTGQTLATATTAGIDFASSVAFAKERGLPSLGELTFAQRGALLGKLSKAIHEHREELLALETSNVGATRGDGKFDLDGGTGTLAYYAKLGESLGDRRVLADGEVEKLARGGRWVGQHVYGPRNGIAVHINAFNFPIWGMAEKLSMAVLAGMPVVTKPATSTALVAHRVAQIMVDANVLPLGAFSFIAGSVGDLFDHLTYQDVVSFTGSSKTAEVIRSHANLIAQNVCVNVEADSLNSAVLGPDLTASDETYDIFLQDVVREMTQKTGQKCTAIRRILVPPQMVEQVAADLKEQLKKIVVGDPNVGREVKMGPLVNPAQLRDVRAGIDKLCEVADLVHGDGGRGEVVGVSADEGSFVSPVLLLARDKSPSSPIHSVEVFGPVATIVPYDGTVKEATQIAAYGGGALVISIYTGDRSFGTELSLGVCASHGRVYLRNAKASCTVGPGAVLPQLTHGGPGRAGAGSELGGLRGVLSYMQRTAIQGYAPWLERALQTAGD